MNIDKIGSLYIQISVPDIHMFFIYLRSYRNFYGKLAFHITENRVPFY